MQEPIRVLYPLVAQPVGGVGTLLKNTFESTEGYEVTIIESSKTTEGAFNAYFLDRGVPIYLFPSVTKPFTYFKACRDFYKEHVQQFDIMHVQSPANALPHLYYAKKYGIKHRIYHSHATRYSDTRLKSIRNWIFLKLALPLATDFLACGRLAGKTILGHHEMTIVPNSIQVQDFLFNAEKRQELRQKYGIAEDTIVLAAVGTMDNRKNQQLIIEAMKALPQDNYEFLLIGQGVNEASLKEMAKDMPNVRFLGRKENMADYYSMMDLVVLPSKFEGFPMIAVEAQANGLPMLVSKTIDKTVDITGRVTFLDISGEQAITEWRNAIQRTEQLSLEERLGMNATVAEKGYTIEKARALLRQTYENILER